jgi:hypothetical protein
VQLPGVIVVGRHAAADGGSGECNAIDKQEDRGQGGKRASGAPAA